MRDGTYITTKFKGADPELTVKISDWVNKNKVHDVTMCYSAYEHELIVGGFTVLDTKEK